jgi:hypothetical protein
MVSLLVGKASADSPLVAFGCLFELLHLRSSPRALAAELFHELVAVGDPPR